MTNRNNPIHVVLTSDDSSGKLVSGSEPLVTKQFDDSLDGMTNAINTIDYEHHEVHAGSHFMICSAQTLDLNGSATFSVTTPNTTKWLHMTFEIEGVSRTTMEVREDAQVSGGVLVTPINNNRNSDKTSVATVRYRPKTINPGTPIFFQSKGIEGTTPAAARGEGIVSREREIILKKNSTTLFIIYSRAANNIVSYCGEWYEHTNRN